MRKGMDLTGQRFGRLEVLHEDAPHTLPSGIRVRKWVCKCDCGNIVSVLQTSLISGDTKSCGCLRRLDLTGQRFGKLEVLHLDPEPYVGPSGRKKRRWVCKCDCGNTVSVLQISLTTGQTKSCGCGKSLPKIDLTGKRFGRLEVLHLDPEPHVGPAGKRERKWVCKCDCGNTVSVFQQALTFGQTKSCGCGKYPHKKDLTGQRFGKLKVLHLDPEPYVSPSGRKMRRWVCKCDCGNVVSVFQHNLTSKNSPTRSCGCLKKKAVQAFSED